MKGREAQKGCQEGEKVKVIAHYYVSCISQL
jgi:hypothetical protein